MSRPIRSDKVLRSKRDRSRQGENIGKGYADSSDVELDAQSRFDVRFIVAPISRRVLPPL